MGIAQFGRGQFASPARLYIAKPTPVRRVLEVLGFMTLIAIAALGGFVGMMVYSGQHLDSESKAFADTALTAITGDWDEQALETRASPELLQVTNPEQLKSLFQNFSKLGHMTSWPDTKGGSTMSVINWTSTITARYTAKAQFQNGTAALSIGLVKEDGRWMINSLNVRSIGSVTPAATHAL
jgi:hypothetical protein